MSKSFLCLWCDCEIKYVSCGERNVGASQMKKLGVVMDPIQSIHYKKDTTLAMLLEAQKRNYELYYFEQKDLFIRDGSAYGNSKQLKVDKDPKNWFQLGETKPIPLTDLDIIFMRKDPPFDVEYIYSTYILELAERQGIRI